MYVSDSDFDESISSSDSDDSIDERIVFRDLCRLIHINFLTKYKRLRDVPTNELIFCIGLIKTMNHMLNTSHFAGEIHELDLNLPNAVWIYKNLNHELFTKWIDYVKETEML
jgi:hypothetical protein